MARIRVRPKLAATNVWLSPNTPAIIGDIEIIDNLWRIAIKAEVQFPDVSGTNIPHTNMNIEKNLPNLCFLKVTKAT